MRGLNEEVIVRIFNSVLSHYFRNKKNNREIPLKIKKNILTDNEEKESSSIPKYKTKIFKDENDKKIYYCIYKKIDEQGNLIFYNSIIESIIEYLNNEFNSFSELQKFNFSENTAMQIKQQTDLNIKETLNSLMLQSYDLIQILSAEKYEKSNCNGILCFSYPKGKIISKIELAQKAEYSYKNIRIIRKLLQTTGNNIGLGISEYDSTYYIDKFVNVKNNCLYVLFDSPGVWKLLYGKETLLVCDNNNYYYFDDSEDEPLTEYKDTISNFLYKKNKERYYKELNRFISELKKVPAFHGALLILAKSKNYANIAYKANRAIMFEKDKQISLFSNKKMQRDLLKQICKIDGATIFDLNGNCQSFATILDGTAKSSDPNLNDISRGSRYNSALTFVKNYNESESKLKYLAIVISEDGPINVFI